MPDSTSLIRDVIYQEYRTCNTWTPQKGVFMYGIVGVKIKKTSA